MPVSPAFQPSSPGARPDEIAVIEVNGHYYSDWETVWIKNQVEVTYSEFRFTCAERDPIPDTWDKLQLKPRDNVTIYLANVPAVKGTIIVRQVAYDANTHGVSLQGVGDPWFAARASIVPAQDMNTEGGIVDIARKILAPTGVQLETVGNIDGTPFNPPVHPNPGETIFSFLERLGRDRKVLMGSTPDGKWLLIGSDNPALASSVIEGFNILSAQFIWNDIGARNFFMATGQKTANDEQNGRQAAEQQAVVQGNLGRYSPLVVPMEHPVWTDHEMQLRAEFEALTSMGTEITATVTVQGWFTPEGYLWQPRMAVTVKSPMAALPTQTLTVVSVTFQQDRSGGTRTTLELKQPWAVLQSGFAMSDSDPNKPPAATSSDAPNTPALPTVQ
jgi:prophage tail gpP-like protein